MPKFVMPHLYPEIEDAGHATMPAINGEFGGFVEASESTASSGPHLWLRMKADLNGPGAAVHLTAENAWRLADQLRTLVMNHYQGNARPDWATD